ncbi:hypothetical protein CO689_09065 [Staphylococcus simulans]|nr:hypothetical protein AL483_07865 [Staphylococcus simulans]ATF30996.1 hypothetical protein CO689_09065 [Staphylococcus simulans]
MLNKPFVSKNDILRQESITVLVSFFISIAIIDVLLQLFTVPCKLSSVNKIKREGAQKGA